MDFDQMMFWQVLEAVKGFDRRTKNSAQIADALIYKLIRGMSFGKPKLVGFDELFPGWAEKPPSAKTDLEIALQNAARLEEWCDIVEGGEEDSDNR